MPRPTVGDMARRKTPSGRSSSRVVHRTQRRASERSIDELTSGAYSEGGPIRCVRLAKRAEKQLGRVPPHIREQLAYWIATVETAGLELARRIPGYRDEPLLGRRSGQRSIRLSRSYRAIYELRGDIARFVSVEEVSKHDY